MNDFLELSSSLIILECFCTIASNDICFKLLSVWSSDVFFQQLQPLPVITFRLILETFQVIIKVIAIADRDSLE